MHCHEPVFEAATLSSFFILGLFGSTHCLGMCGPLTCMVFQRNTSKWDIFQYHAFRLLSYTSFTIILAIIGSVALKN
ncbi:MAG: sulfite exporter TauE/SafE family protein, partial [Proteobacteria bacterium]|nr:sulfite exporter TauE/SafE family protein [Pseudomonadota bacterium]